MVNVKKYVSIVWQNLYGLLLFWLTTYYDVREFCKFLGQRTIDNLSVQNFQWLCNNIINWYCHAGHPAKIVYNRAVLFWAELYDYERPIEYRQSSQLLYLQRTNQVHMAVGPSSVRSCWRAIFAKNHNLPHTLLTASRDPPYIHCLLYRPYCG